MLALVSLFIAGAYVGWNIGANDAGNCIGTSVASGLIPYRRAILLVAVFVAVGALLQGESVVETVGKGIVSSELSWFAVFSALVGAGVFVTVATFLQLPVSTSQAVVGGVASVGLATAASVDFLVILRIARAWVLCPILSGVLAYVLYRLLAIGFRRIQQPEVQDRIMKWFLLSSVCYVSFSLGANHLGNAVGPIANLGLQQAWLPVLGAAAMSLGALSLGHRVAEMVGSGITALDPLGAACAQAAAAFSVHLFSLLGVPVSTSQAIVGAVVGVGLIKGTRAVRRGKVLEIVGGWVATPLAAGILSFALYHLISWVA